MVVLLGGIGVQGDDIAFGQQGLQRHILRDLLHLCIGVQIVGQQTAAKARQMLQYRAANAAGADHAHRAGGDVPADLSLQRVVLRFPALEDVARLAQAHQHEHNGKVRNAVWGIIHIGHLHPQRSGSLAVHMVVADGAAADGLYAQFMEALYHGRAHIAGRYRYSVIALCQLCIFQCGIFLRIAELDIQLRCQPLCNAQLIVRTQRVKKDFCCHRTSLPADFVFILTRSARTDAFLVVNYIHLLHEDAYFHADAAKRVVKNRKRGYDRRSKS